MKTKGVILFSLHLVLTVCSGVGATHIVDLNSTNSTPPYTGRDTAIGRHAPPSSEVGELANLGF
jgi:hypothetical protein